MKVLVIDIGGTHVKVLATDEKTRRKFDSTPHLTPGTLVEQVLELTADWQYDVVSIGYPGIVGPHGPVAEPGNLGDGWIGFAFEKAFKKPVRVVNDAAMQALGAYEGGRMLFLGVGTGLGSALVAERVVVPLELGCLPYNKQWTIGERLGRLGRRKLGMDRAWQEAVCKTCLMLRKAFAADYMVLGGGKADEVETLPEGVRRGGNHDAFTGGFRLWEEWVEPHDSAPSSAWRVVR